jgi:hypothetical protein
LDIVSAAHNEKIYNTLADPIEVHEIFHDSSPDKLTVELHHHTGNGPSALDHAAVK